MNLQQQLQNIDLNDFVCIGTYTVKPDHKREYRVLWLDTGAVTMGFHSVEEAEKDTHRIIERRIIAEAIQAEKAAKQDYDIIDAQHDDPEIAKLCSQVPLYRPE